MTTEEMQKRISELEEQNLFLEASIEQVTALYCDDCGWAMKFPDELCRCHLATRVEALQKEAKALRGVLQECAQLVGANISPDCTLAFMQYIPKELSLTLDKLRGQLTLPLVQEELPQIGTLGKGY